MLPKDSSELESYLAERLSTCPDNITDPEANMNELIKAIRSRRKFFVINGTVVTEETEINEEKKEIVNSALGAYDRLIDKDVKIWNRMDQVSIFLN